MSKRQADQGTGNDVYDLPEEDRESLHENTVARDTFSAIGIDDFVSVDKVIAGNGDRFFVTSAR